MSRGYITYTEAGRYLQGMLDDFAKKFKQHSQIGSKTLPSLEVINLRETLIIEEVSECLLGLEALKQVAKENLGRETPLDRAQYNAALLETYDGLLDAVYVLIGTASALGLNFGEGFAEVHRSNMSKTPPPEGTETNPGNKYHVHNPKGEGYTPPNLESLL